MISYGLGVSLGLLNPARLETYRAWRNDRRVWDFCRQNDLISMDQHIRWFDRIKTDPKIKMYEILDEDEKPIGVCGLTDIDYNNQSAEFSLYISPDRSGNGFGSKALMTLVLHGFKNLGMNHIWGETFEDNHAAKVFETLGFVKEGTRRKFYNRRGKYIDAHLYSMIREDSAWQSWL